MTSPSAGRPVARCANRDHCGPKCQTLQYVALLLTAVAFVASAPRLSLDARPAARRRSLETQSRPRQRRRAPAHHQRCRARRPRPGRYEARSLPSIEAFWRALPGASRAAASHRRALLSKYTANPELGSLLAGMARQDREGKVIYGFDKPHAVVSTLALSQGVAVVSDCQDSSQSGVARRTSGRRLTVGVKRNHVVSTMHRGADGAWRVSFVAYPKTPC